MRILRLPNSDLERFFDRLEKETIDIKDEIFRLSWYMRGGVSAYELFHVYSVEDRKLMSDLAKENIELTKKSGISLL
jgi:hypothetical protein